MAALSSSAVTSKMFSIGPFKVEAVWTIDPDTGVSSGSFKSKYIKDPIGAAVGLYSPHTSSSNYTVLTSFPTIATVFTGTEAPAFLIFGF